MARWKQKLKGKKLRAGEHDFYVVVLDRFGIWPELLDTFDPDFVAELQAFLEADAEHQREQIKELERKH